MKADLITVRKKRDLERASTRPQNPWSAPTVWKPLILCVDDTPSILEGRKMLLVETGYGVLTATNGTDSVETFMSHSIDLVLLDYHMPGMKGAVARHG